MTQEYQAMIWLPYSFEIEVTVRLKEIFQLLGAVQNPVPPNFEAQTIAALDQIVVYLQATNVARRPVRIILGPPLTLKQGKLVMANIELQNDEVLFIPILTDDAAGSPVPPPAGDTFFVLSSSPSLAAVIDTTTLSPPGTPAVKINATVQVSPGLSFTVSDSAGLTKFVQGVDIVADTTPKAITLDFAHELTQSQPAPTAPGP